MQGGAGWRGAGRSGNAVGGAERSAVGRVQGGAECGAECSKGQTEPVTAQLQPNENPITTQYTTQLEPNSQNTGLCSFCLKKEIRISIYSFDTNTERLSFVNWVLVEL